MMLGCDPVNFDAPCLEFAGDCADLATQYQDIPSPDGSGQPAIPPLWECEKFPNENIWSDKIITSLIMTAIAWLTKNIIERLFGLSNDAPAPEAWVRVVGLGKFLLGKANWRYRGYELGGKVPSALKRLYAKKGIDWDFFTFEVIKRGIFFWRQHEPPYLDSSALSDRQRMRQQRMMTTSQRGSSSAACSLALSKRSSFAPGASDFSRAGFPGVGQSKRFAPSPPFAALRRGGHSSRIGSIGSGDAAASPEDVHVATGSGGGGSPMMMIMRQPLQSNRSMQPARIRGATSFNWTGGAAGASKRMSYDAAAERKRSISPSRRGGAAKDVPPATSVAVGGSSRAFSGEGGLSPTNAAGAGSGSPKKRSLRGSATLVGTPYPTSASSATGRLSRTLSSMPPGLSFRPVGSAGVETTEEEDSFLQGMAEEQVAQWRKVILAHVFIYVTWAILSWFIFAYGLLIYKLLGTSAEQAFAADWGTGLAIEQASQLRDIVKALFWEILILILLDQLRLVPAGSWFENQMDLLSVQATLFIGRGTAWSERITAHMRFYHRIEN